MQTVMAASDINSMITTRIRNKAQQIQLIVFDIDGVFTDGKIIYSNNGIETKHFYVSDGVGIQLLLKSGLSVAVISARQSPLNLQRMQELGIELIYQQQVDKWQTLQTILAAKQISLAATAYVGDDLADVKSINNVGLGIAVANADEFVKQHAAWVTRKAGGFGAVREVCEMILASQARLAALQQQFLHG